LARLNGLDGESDSVVFHNRGNSASAALDNDAGSASLSMPEDIGESFLHHSVDGRFDLGREAILEAETLHIDPNRGAVAPVPSGGHERPFEPQIVECGRSKVRGCTMNVPTDVARDGFEPAHMDPCGLVADVVQHFVKRIQSKQKACHGLADLIMKLQGDPALFSFLRCGKAL
jgi:hypothetical protein